jgi:hypothetical protein
MLYFYEEKREKKRKKKTHCDKLLHLRRHVSYQEKKRVMMLTTTRWKHMSTTFLNLILTN